MLGNSLNSLYFGFSVAINNNFVVVGAPSEDNVGSVYIFHTDDSWESNSGITHECINGKNKFGFSIDINADNLIIGSPGINGLPGKAVLYNFNSFFDANKGFISDSLHKKPIQFETILTKSRSSKALFGRSVSIQNNFLIVSGFGKTDEDEHVGSVFLYSYNLYNKKNNIQPIACLRDKSAKELFGHNVAINDKYIIIGDPTENKVHIYLLNKLLNTYIKKWNWSSYSISPNQIYNLEINN